MTKREKYIAIFDKYVPKVFSPVLADLLLASNVSFKVVKSRKTKLGDFRMSQIVKQPIITINRDLNQYSFLITSLHEFAHYHTFQKYGNSVSPHGKEWKEAFRILLLPVINSGQLPKDIETALMSSLVNTKASSCSDLPLSRTLHRYNNSVSSEYRLEELPKNATFALNNRFFLKLNKRRTRYECKELSSGKIFLVHALATVIKTETDE
jgi:SprT protein